MSIGNPSSTQNGAEWWSPAQLRASAKWWAPKRMSQHRQQENCAKAFLKKWEQPSRKLSPVVEVVWPWDGERVEVAGSWNNWTPVPMVYDEKCMIHRLQLASLPPGRMSYKFVVDGRWRYDGNKPIVADDRGNVNNVLVL